MKTSLFLVMTGSLVLTALVQAAELESLPGDGSMPVSAEHFKVLKDVCETCHGPGGASPRDDVPVLAGRPAEELLAEMERFYFYERHCPDVDLDPSDISKGKMSMCDVTGQMNKAEALALANYFETGTQPSGSGSEPPP